LMQPAFHRTHIAAFGTLMTEATTAMLGGAGGPALNAP
jgi:hypothetical protein